TSRLTIVQAVSQTRNSIPTICSPVRPSKTRLISRAIEIIGFAPIPGSWGPPPPGAVPAERRRRPVDMASCPRWLHARYLIVDLPHQRRGISPGRTPVPQGARDERFGSRVDHEYEFRVAVERDRDTVRVLAAH